MLIPPSLWEILQNFLLPVITKCFETEGENHQMQTCGMLHHFELIEV